MNHILILAILLAAATPAQAGFKFYGANGQTMNSTETEEERTNRVARETQHVTIVNDWYRSLPPLVPEAPASPQRRDRKNPISLKEVDAEWKPKLDGGPAPGGHRRHEWREKTGFNTPAERTRYRRAVREEKERLRKEKSKPNPAGAHPEEIRKQFKTKF